MKHDLSSIENIFTELQHLKVDEDEGVQLKPITLWIPEHFKVAFDSLQSQTRNKFGKKIKELVISAISITRVEDKES